MRTIIWHTIAFWLVCPLKALDIEILQNDETLVHEEKTSLSFTDFQNLLHTELNDEMKGMDMYGSTSDGNFTVRKLTQEELPSELMWDQIRGHGWDLFKQLSRSEKSLKRRYLNSDLTTESSDQDNALPFLVCSRTPLLQSGAQRLPPIMQITGAEQKDSTIVSNEEHQTCLIITTTFQKAKFVDTSISNDEYVIVPLIDLMKISEKTINQVQSEDWKILSFRERFDQRLRGEEAGDWERVIRVNFAAERDQGSSGRFLVRKGVAILRDIENMGTEGSRRRRLLLNSTIEREGMFSLADAFSITSTIALNTNRSNGARSLLSRSRLNSLSRSLELGIEASHSCENMFETLVVRPVIEDNGVEIVLNPAMNCSMTHKLQDADTDSSASNSDCIVSLIIGLSVHPQVLNVDTDLPLNSDDFESQWITQSGSYGKRPIFDAGLTGKGQIVSVTDSGCDVDHRFFQPISDDIYEKWVLTSRKIVRYEHDAKGDKRDQYQGHGTRVAGIIAGSVDGGEQNEADGVAIGAQIHMWDIQSGSGGFSVPGPNKLFRSIYNDGKGAKITNASWSSSYRPYSTRCRMYDASLRDKFDNILFVTSAGNAANDVPGKVMNTIGEPASCKNTLAVGASQSHGERLYTGDRGQDYLADFSSRGPTMDGRIKPDVVAVGYTVLAPRAYPHLTNKKDAYETFGTSFSAPVVSGSAALIRQYFEEGWFPCGQKGCGEPILPSGSLMKAVLVNGAQSLMGIQKVPGGYQPAVIDTVNDYDHNQGFGLINVAKSIPIKTSEELNFNGFAVNNRALENKEKESIVLITKQCESMDLSVTLSWFDPAGAANCAKCLVNNLDLSVKKGAKTFYPNGLVGPDALNNVERIRLDALGAGKEIEIVVDAQNLATPSEKYSLIVTGCFDIVPEKSSKGLVPCS